MELQYSLHQIISLDSFMYCEEEYEFRAVESEDRPSNVESKPTYGGVTSGGCTKVQTAPCAYEQRAEAKRDDPESAPLRWFWHPNWRGVARSGGIGRRILHLFCGSVRTIGPAWLRESGDLYSYSVCEDAAWRRCARKWSISKSQSIRKISELSLQSTRQTDLSASSGTAHFTS